MTGNNGIGITTKCKDPERLMEFFDYLLQKDVQTYLLWGEEGKDWNTTSDGGRMQTPERRELMKDDAKKRNETGHTLWNYCPKRQGFYADGTPCTPDDSADEYLASLSDYDKEFLGKFGFKYPAQFLSEPEERPSYYPVWSMTIEEGSAAAQANTKMNEIIRRAYPQLILAEDDAKFESVWSDMLKQFEEADLQPYLDEVDRQIATFN
jgi:putative aldouronate transport system substrate-binding protein